MVCRIGSLFVPESQAARIEIEPAVIELYFETNVWWVDGLVAAVACMAVARLHPDLVCAFRRSRQLSLIDLATNALGGRRPVKVSVGFKINVSSGAPHEVEVLIKRCAAIAWSIAAWLSL